jgi:hypothetical protein
MFARRLAEEHASRPLDEAQDMPAATRGAAGVTDAVGRGRIVFATIASSGG